MAKKTAHKTAEKQQLPKFPKLKTGRSGTKRPKPQATPAARKARHRQPSAAPLPGMERVRDAVLDRLCESMGEEMAVINEAARIIKTHKAAALARMRDRGISRRVHGGVIVVLHEGTATLSVKLAKETTEDVVERTAGPSTVAPPQDVDGNDDDEEVTHADADADPDADDDDA